MVYSHHGDEDVWIQVSDSQLKIKPHPQKGDMDDEQLTFEVVNWTKTLKPADLNVQLLGVLDNGGPVRQRLPS